MPMSKKVGKYPSHFHDLLLVTKNVLPLVIECETEAKAKQRRLQIYGFTEALRREKHPGVSVLDGFTLRVEGSKLMIEDRDAEDSEFALQLQRAAREAAIRNRPVFVKDPVTGQTIRNPEPIPLTPLTPAAPSSSVLDGTQVNQAPAPLGQEHDNAIARYLKGEKS